MKTEAYVGFPATDYLRIVLNLVRLIPTYCLLINSEHVEFRLDTFCHAIQLSSRQMQRMLSVSTRKAWFFPECGILLCELSVYMTVFSTIYAAIGNIKRA